MRPETLVAQAGHVIDPATGAIVPPIHVSTTYARGPGYQLIDGRDYSRDKNPGYAPIERVLTELEGGADALVFASGMAAATTTMRAVLSAGAHVIAPRASYFAVRRWLGGLAAKWGVQVHLVDTTDVAAVAAAVRPNTKLVWVETPANPTWEVSDIAALAELAHRAGARLVVDSTAGTPVHQRPITLGADFVVHSATKYLGGHSDVIAGAVICARQDEVWDELRLARREEGAVLGPYEASLLLRGLRTLFVRVERQSASALAIARSLEGRGVRVLYPGLASHPQHAVAARQMHGGFGGMLSIQTGGGAARAIAVAERLAVWVRSTSLGGVESLVEHRHSVEGADTPTPADLLRLSVGLEHADDLLDDLVAALG